MRKSTNTLTPTQVYRYAVESCQPHLKLGDTKRVTAQMLLTILFAAAARVSSLSDTCKRLRGDPTRRWSPPRSTRPCPTTTS